MLIHLARFHLVAPKARAGPFNRQLVVPRASTTATVMTTRSTNNTIRTTSEPRPQGWQQSYAPEHGRSRQPTRAGRNMQRNSVDPISTVPPHVPGKTQQLPQCSSVGVDEKPWMRRVRGLKCMSWAGRISSSSVEQDRVNRYRRLCQMYF